MDRITMHVKCDSDKGAVLPKLEDMVRTGLSTTSQFSHVFTANQGGAVNSSLEPIVRIGLCFAAPQNGPAEGLS